MKVKIEEHFLAWFKITNPHLYDGKTKVATRNKELEEYVNDVLLEHMDNMDKLLEEDDDDSPDSGFIEE